MYSRLLQLLSKAMSYFMIVLYRFSKNLYRIFEDIFQISVNKIEKIFIKDIYLRYSVLYHNKKTLHVVLDWLLVIIYLRNSKRSFSEKNI